MNKLLLIGLLIAGFNAEAYEQTDYACLNDCTAKGNQYGLCKARCSWDNAPQQAPTYQAPKIKQTDYQCVTNCTNQNYQYNFCVEKCSY